MATETFSEAQRLFEQNQFHQALPIFKKCYEEENKSDTAKYIRLCQQRLARILWRHGRASDLNRFMQETQSESILALSVARLYGPQRLSAFAEKEAGITSTLAKCSIRKDCKTSLLILRKIPEFKALAEGWISFLKGDDERALASFRLAEQTLPFQAHIGMGIAYLLLGEWEKSKVGLKAMRPFPKHFNHLSQTLSKNHLVFNSRKQLKHYLFHASLKELKEAEQTLSPYLKTHKAWICLRIGDHLLLQQSKKEALIYWKRATSYSSAVKLDVLKRRYLLAYNSSAIISFDAFFDFYRALRSHSQENAKEFVEHLVFDSTHSANTLLTPQELRSHSGRWTFDSSRIELQLLWLHLFYHQRLSALNKAIYIPKRIVEIELLLSEKTWESLFKELDPHYGHKELYLQYRLIVAKLLRKTPLIRETVIKLLKINAHLQEELIPLYFKATILELFPNFINGQSIEIDFWRGEKNKTHHDVQNLLHYFPNNFDLLRLEYLTQSFEKKTKKITDYSTYLSEPLFALFKLQCALDEGRPTKQCKKSIPPPSLIGKSQEADFRLIAALSHPKMKFPKKHLNAFCDEVASDSSLKHALFQHLERYDIIVPLSLLRTWKQRNPQDWQPYYHIAKYYGMVDEEEKCIQAIEQAYFLTPDHLSEKGELEVARSFSIPPFEEIIEDILRKQ